MSRAVKLMWIWLLVLLSFGSVNAYPTDEDEVDYENTRVARITLVRGDVQVRRNGSSDWEEAVTNLPLIEGDRIATGRDSRVEVQFDRDNYLRLAENSLLKIVTLNDNSTAVSLPEGILSLRLGKFNPKRDSFEIDAPQSTVAVENEGLYRVDVPQGSSSPELRVTVTGGGQARVYSETSGYTVRNGRTARVFLTGEYAGDVDFVTASSFRDYFDDWVAEREDRITRNRRDEYRAYYDNSIYGADDLNEYGEWYNTGEYGWVWRPYNSSVAGYRNWSPYRYGYWRHLPGYGWTWIPDEPWGWATSHYGRWVWADGGWAWCPYEYHRRGYRVRWHPSRVIFVPVGRNICWYPLPYNHYYSYSYHRRKVVYNRTIIINNPRPTPTPAVTPTPTTGSPRELRMGWRQIYGNAVTGMPAEQFGKLRKGIAPVASDDAEQAVDKVLGKNTRVEVDLPIFVDYGDSKIGKNHEIVADRKTLGEAERRMDTADSKIGAMKRERGVPLDDKLREERVFKGRTPVLIEDRPTENAEETPKPRTGVFDRRLPGKRDEAERNDDSERPTPRPRTDSKKDRETETPPIFDRNDDNRRPRKEERDDDNRKPRNNDSPPIYSPPPSYDPPKQREEPRYEPPPRNDPPPPPKNDPPPPTKNDDSPPPSKDKPGKDGRKR